MTYTITDYTRKQAKKLGVRVELSKNPKKKLDVYDKYGLKLCSIGSSNYYDYPTYLEVFGKEVAEKRRKLYKQRHEKDRHIIGSPGFFSDKLLW